MKFKIKSISIILSLFTLVCFVSVKQVQAEPQCVIADNAFDIASRIRGLKEKHKVPCRLVNQEQVEVYLRKVIKEKITETLLENEGQMFKLLGFVPEDFAYVDGLVSLYTSQLGGYYEPAEEYYGMASWLPDSLQMPIAVHELTHALQDQHFDLDKMMDQKKSTTDELLARSALVEGDATAVMLDYTRGLQGLPGIKNEKNVTSFMFQNLLGAGVSSSMNQAPPSLQAMILFPYVSGLNFAHQNLLRGGYDELNKVYVTLPNSTEEVLHPEKYLERIDSGKKGNQKSAELIDKKNSKAKHTDTFGEFFISTLLGRWLPALDASQGASGWGDDFIQLYSDKEGKHSLTWDIAWDNKTDCQEFVDSLIKAYEKRLSVSAESKKNGFLIMNSKYSIGIEVQDEIMVQILIKEI
jgi:hypothetical protein